MTKKIFYTIIAPLLLLGLGNEAYDNISYSETTISTCGIENTTFQPGESITYQLSYKWGVINATAGYVTFSVEDMGDTYRFRAVGKTAAGIEWFYRVNDNYETTVNKQTLLPISARKKIEEGKYRLYEEVEFDHSAGVATTKRGRTRDNLKSKEIPIESCMYDILSIIYLTRNLDLDALKMDEKFAVRFFMDKKVYPIDVIYKGRNARKRIKGNGLHKTIYFKPQLVKNELFPNGGEMDVWVTDDDNRIPLLLESPLSVGRVRGILKETKGLRNEPASRLK